MTKRSTISAAAFLISVLSISVIFSRPKEIDCCSETQMAVSGLDSFNSDLQARTLTLSADENQYEYRSSNKTAYVNSNAVVIREEPSDESEIAFTAEYASKISIMGEDINQSSGWTKVYSRGSSGYIRTQYITDEVLFIPKEQFFYVSVETALRSSPDMCDESIVATLSQNTRLKQTGYNEDWLEVEMDGNRYYISSNASSSAMIFFEEEKTLYIKEKSYLKAKPFSTDNYNVVQLDKNTKILQTEYNNDWIKVLYNDDFYYIEKSNTTPYIVKETKTRTYTIAFDDTIYSGDIAKVIETAYDLLGTPYVWNGSSKYGTDCSGFTMQCYNAVGISLPHRSSDQALYGRDVMNEELRPGDLMMFSDKSSSSISHVALYIGDGKIMHAATVDVTISDLKNYCKYGGTIRAVRRFIEN